MNSETAQVMGMFAVGTAIMLYIMSAIAIGSGIAEGDPVTPVIIGLVCAVGFATPLLVIGIRKTRQVEDSESGAQHSVSPATSDSIRGFDLNRLNWVGWLLVLTTIGLVLAAALWIAFYVGNGAWGGRRPPKMLGIPILFGAITFFVVARWILKKFGVSIFR